MTNIDLCLGLYLYVLTVNGQHKVIHPQQGTCQCKCFMVTQLSPPIMLVEYVQKLALILIVIIFKPSIETLQQWCHIAWDSFEMVARRTQTKQTVNRSKLVHNWLNLGSQRAKFVNDNDDESNHAKQCPYCKQQEEDVQHMLTCSHRSALKTR